MFCRMLPAQQNRDTTERDPGAFDQCPPNRHALGEVDSNHHDSVADRNPDHQVNQFRVVF